jgi:hypothetical protein
LLLSPQVCAYVNNVRQHAVVRFAVDVGKLAAGNVASVTFVLQSRPEVIEVSLPVPSVHARGLREIFFFLSGQVGARLVFRNERVKGIGKVIKVVPLAMGSPEELDETPGLDI